MPLHLVTRKYADTDVEEDEAFGKEVDCLEELPGTRASFLRKVVEGVVRLTDTTEEHSYDA